MCSILDASFEESRLLYIRCHHSMFCYCIAELATNTFSYGHAVFASPLLLLRLTSSGSCMHTKYANKCLANRSCLIPHRQACSATKSVIQQQGQICVYMYSACHKLVNSHRILNTLSNEACRNVSDARLKLAKCVRLIACQGQTSQYANLTQSKWACNNKVYMSVNAT